MFERKKRSGVMLCYPFEEKRLDKYPPPYIVQPKLDGVRCRAQKMYKGNFILMSSTEELIFSVPHILEALNAYSLYLPEELDGELYAHDLQFESIYSITSRTANIHPNHEQIKFHIFDLPDNEGTPQIERFLALDSLNQTFYNTNCLIPVEYRIAHNFTDVITAYAEFTDANYEGIIVRDHTAPYIRRRSTQVMKFKPKKQDAYLIVGGQEEYDKHGNPKESLGAFLCDSGDGSGETFSVGSGLTQSQRQVYWNILDEIISNNSYALVEYQHITPGRKVPRFPIFTSVISPTEAKKYEE